MREHYKTKEQRLSALRKTIDTNTSQDPVPIKSASYTKTLEYIDRLSDIEFSNCLATRDDGDDIWDTWIWIDTILCVLIWDEESIILSIYEDGNNRLNQEFEDFEEVIEILEKLVAKNKYEPII